MEYRQLGRSDIKVSAICLGTMMYGEQAMQDEAFQQMDYALDRGVTFWDAAEMYPVPPKAETYGRTEEILGNWFAARKKRDKVILATKVAGPDKRLGYVRGGNARLNKDHMTRALEASLKRLKTDYVDLYQLHWTERETNVFGRLGYAPSAQEDGTPLDETLAALADLVKGGKVRQVGISNESAWGAMRYLALSEAGGGPRIVSVQNSYNLLNRTFEAGLAEVALRESCGLLAYSPLGMGVLSGKYVGGAWPSDARTHAVQALAALHDPVRLRRHRALCEAGARAWPRSRADGAGIHQYAALHHGQHHRRKDNGAIEDRHRQHRAQAEQGGA